MLSNASKRTTAPSSQIGSTLSVLTRKHSLKLRWISFASNTNALSPSRRDTTGRSSAAIVKITNTSMPATSSFPSSTSRSSLLSGTENTTIFPCVLSFGALQSRFYPLLLHLIFAPKFRNELVAYGSSFIPKFRNTSLTNLQAPDFSFDLTTAAPWYTLYKIEILRPRAAQYMKVR